jgi:hypothetical protein
MTFRPSTQESRARREAERAANFRALCQPVQSLHRGSYSGAVAKPAARVPAKIERKANQKIRDSARGEECTVRLPGVCTHETETVIWSHYPLNDAGKGMGTKSLDLAGCYLCAACHDVVDGRAPRPAGMTHADVLLAWFKGHMRSLVRLAAKGLV